MYINYKQIKQAILFFRCINVNYVDNSVPNKLQTWYNMANLRSVESIILCFSFNIRVNR